MSISTHVLDAISRRDLAAVELAVPQYRIRRTLLETAADFMPVGDWTLEINAGDLCAKVDAMSRATTLEWLSLESPAVDVDVIGELIAIKFESKTITIKFPPTGKHLEADYSLDLEETLFQERRGMVQVSGTAILDDEAQPTELLEVTAIRLVDLGPIEVSAVRHGGIRLVAKTPFVVVPTLSKDDGQLFEGAYDAFGIDAYASTREKLLLAIQEDLAFVWECYALEQPDKLSADAKALRQRLLDSFEAV